MVFKLYTNAELKSIRHGSLQPDKKCVLVLKPVPFTSGFDWTITLNQFFNVFVWIFEHRKFTRDFIEILSTISSMILCRWQFANILQTFTIQICPTLPLFTSEPEELKICVSREIFHWISRLWRQTLLPHYLRTSNCYVTKIQDNRNA